jgi:hypothetical protein
MLCAYTGNKRLYINRFNSIIWLNFDIFVKNVFGVIFLHIFFCKIIIKSLEPTFDYKI